MDSAFGLITLFIGWTACCWLSRELCIRQTLLRDWRLILALGTGLWGALTVVIVESLSLLHGLNKPGVLAAWVITDALLLLASLHMTRQRGALAVSVICEKLKSIRQSIHSLPLFAKCCWTGVVLIAAFLLGVAVSTPSTNWDSLSYHLPRVMHWLQQQSVEHFPTENSRQIEFGPWSGFVLAQLFLLDGTDRLMNLPQWLAMILSVVLASYLVELLGKACGLRWCLEETAEARAKRQNAAALAALVALTIPMGMMQAMTPQTDYVAAFWAVCLHVFVLALFLEPGNRLCAWGAGLALGLGLLSKSTTLLYVAPLLIGASIVFVLRRTESRETLRIAGVIALVALLMNVPHSLRNYQLFGSPLGSPEIQQMVANQRLTPGIFASNLLRNLAMHNNCGFPWLTHRLNAMAQTVHGWTGQKIDDPATTYPPDQLILIDQRLVYDDYASAPLHVLWIALACALAFRHPRRNVKLLLYAGCIFASFALFAALLKFQVWHSRFHLAYLVLFSPFVAIVLMDKGPRWAQSILPLSVYAYACFCLYVNEARPIFHPRFVSLPRERQYLDIQGNAWNPALQRIAREISASGSRQVGLKLGFDAFEYPIWVMLRNQGFTGRIDHTYVEHVSACLRPDAPSPDAIISKVQPVPAEVARLYPYRTVCPPLMLLSSHAHRGSLATNASSDLHKWGQAVPAP